MPRYHPSLVLGPDGSPSAWGEALQLHWNIRDTLLYAVGIGSRNLRFVYEGHPNFAVFPTFPIRFGTLGAASFGTALPHSLGPLTIDAERFLEMHRPLPTAGMAQICSRVVGIHPRPKGSSFVEYETLVSDSAGMPYCRLVTGQYRRGVNQLGDIEPFEGCGTTYSTKLTFPSTPPDLTCEQWIPENQALIYRLSGDFNPLHIDMDAARIGGFDQPILHGLCTFGHCASMLLGAFCDGDPSRFKRIKVRFTSPVFMNSKLRVHAWHDGPGRVLFQAEVDGRLVVAHAYFEFEEAPRAAKL
ncbi:HSD17B4 [Symbiodinium microadriaticum]|nr:HSD17B4 [Symbiodinium sp. KB8]CAE7223022.1 HSD17B4 [Symbiodinium microadriaticum]